MSRMCRFRSGNSAALTRTNFRWTVMTMAFFITIVNSMDRSVISYAIEPIKREFHLNDTALGSIFAAFGIGYMVSPFIGWWTASAHGGFGLLPPSPGRA
jgi:MFS family permease